MQIAPEHVEMWAAKFDRYDRRKVFELLDTSHDAPSWTPRRRAAQELLTLVELAGDQPQLFKQRVRALATALRLRGWCAEWQAQRRPASSSALAG